MNRRLWTKLYRDITGTWGRTVMMTLAISVSLMVFGSMLFAYSLEKDNATKGYLSTNPASARITLHPDIAPGSYGNIIDTAKNVPNVIDASMRTVTSVNMPKDNDKTEPLVLYVSQANDPLDIATFNVEQGSWPAARDEVFIEKTSLKSMNLKVGDTVEVIGFDGQKRNLKIAGEAHDQSLALAGTEGGVGYVTDATLQFLGKKGGLDQLAITVGDTTPTLNRDEIVSTASAVAKEIARVSGSEVEEIAVPPPGEHPHQAIANSVLTGLLTFGALALVLSSILIAVMFNALLTQQIPQIGILKSIGARTSSVLQYYLTMVLLIAGSATLIAILPALVFGRFLASFLLESAMNIEVSSYAVDWMIVTGYFGAGIGLPLIIALVPLLRFSRKTVREALDHRGTTSDNGRFTRKFFTAIGRLRGIDRMLLMALRNLFRRRGRSLLSIGLLAVAGALFIAGLNVKDGFNAIPLTVYESNAWDAQISLKTPAPASEARAALAKVEGITATDVWYVGDTSLESPGEDVVTGSYPDKGHGKARISAIPADTQLFTPPQMIEGRFLQANETGVVVLPSSARQTLPDVKIGDTITLPVADQKAPFRVVGIAKELAGASCPCVTRAGLEQAFGISGGNSIRIATTKHDKTSREEIAKSAAAALNNAGMPTNGAVPIDRIVESTAGHSDILVQLILLIAISIGVVGLMGLNSMMSTSVVERTRELGVMKSIGAPTRSIIRLVVYEGISIALISFVLAIIPAFLLASAIGAGLGNMFFYAPIPSVSNWETFAMWSAILLVGTIFATLTPAYRAARITIREALAYL